MRVKMTKLLAGPDGAMQPGKEYEVDEAFAKTLVAAEAAVVVGGSLSVDEVETATTDAPENATAAPQRGKKRS